MEREPVDIAQHPASQPSKRHRVKAKKENRPPDKEFSGSEEPVAVVASEAEKQVGKQRKKSGKAQQKQQAKAGERKAAPASSEAKKGKALYDREAAQQRA